MNNKGLERGLKNRETTDEWVDMAYPGFDYNLDHEGVSMDDLMHVLHQVAM